MRQQNNVESKFSADALWRFSLAFYARPGVAEALIALQDRAGLDVNLILFAVWRGIAHAHSLNRAELAAAEAAVAPLRRKVVLPLRELRRRLKAERDVDMQALRQQVAALELVAERRAQARLAATVTAPSGDGDWRAAAKTNLALCLGNNARSPEAAALARTVADFMHGC